MTEELHITSSVVISQQQVFKNTLPIFENKTVDLPGFLIAIYHHLDIKYPKFYKMDNLSKLGWLAAEILLKESFEAGKYEAKEVGVVFSNSSSSLDADLKYIASIKDIASPALFVYTLPNIVIGEICIKHTFKGENAFFITKTFDAAFTEKYVSNLFNSNILQACICGWVEVIGEQYKAVLFLVEKNIASGMLQMFPHRFSAENLNKIYHFNNG